MGVARGPLTKISGLIGSSLTFSRRSASFQDELHIAIKAIEDNLAERLAKASAKDSWRLNRELFCDDSSYIRSGLFNISAGWYPPGRSVRRWFFYMPVEITNFLSISVINLNLPLS